MLCSCCRSVKQTTKHMSDPLPSVCSREVTKAQTPASRHIPDVGQSPRWRQENNEAGEDEAVVAQQTIRQERTVASLEEGAALSKEDRTALSMEERTALLVEDRTVLLTEKRTGLSTEERLVSSQEERLVKNRNNRRTSSMEESDSGSPDIGRKHKHEVRGQVVIAGDTEDLQPVPRVRPRLTTSNSGAEIMLGLETDEGTSAEVEIDSLESDELQPEEIPKGRVRKTSIVEKLSKSKESELIALSMMESAGQRQREFEKLISEHQELVQEISRTPSSENILQVVNDS